MLKETVNLLSSVKSEPFKPLSEKRVIKFSVEETCRYRQYRQWRKWREFIYFLGMKNDDKEGNWCESYSFPWNY